MKKIMLLLFLFPGLIFAQGCIVGNKPSKAKYVCYDGRSMTCTSNGVIWYAKRGCFLSARPCCDYAANHYGYFPDPQHLYKAYEECRVNYPFHMGEMQTH